MITESAAPEGHETAAVVEARAVSRQFDERLVLDRVSLEAERGEIHALLGPNGAGKTTLLRILSGLVIPTSGTARIAGIETSDAPRGLRALIGLVPSGDRSFYLRVSALENLVFFARLYGFRRRPAVERARLALERVGLAQDARKRVGLYSHGMQKRLSFARALLVEPLVLLVDEATHDLDPEGAERVRSLARDAAARGAAIVWTTQRVDEIRGMAERVTLLDRGMVRFTGTVPGLMAHADPQRWVLRLRDGRRAERDLVSDLQAALSGVGQIDGLGHGDEENYVLSLVEGTDLGDALTRISAADVAILACREERSDIESAFLSLTGSDAE